MRMQINWGVFGIFGVLIIGFIVAGFLVSPGAETDDGHPLNIFFFVMAGMFALSIGGVILWAKYSNRRRERIEKTWFDAEAKIWKSARREPTSTTSRNFVFGFT